MDACSLIKIKTNTNIHNDINSGVDLNWKRHKSK